MTQRNKANHTYRIAARTIEILISQTPATSQNRSVARRSNGWVESEIETRHGPRGCVRSAHLHRREWSNHFRVQIETGPLRGDRVSDGIRHGTPERALNRTVESDPSGFS